MERRVGEKSNDSLASIHEGLGIITEEFHELVEAVRSNNHAKVVDELLDIEVGCMFLRACIVEGTLSW